MARVFSFSVPDSETFLLQQLEQVKQEGNLSKLILRLLKGYFEGNVNINQFSKELLEIKKLQKEMQEWLEKAKYFESKISEFEKLLKDRQEKEEIEKNLPLIRKLREIVFDDIQDILNNGKIVSPEQAIKARLTTFATEHKLSYPESVELFFKAFPELRNELEGKL